jgi:hypothetical protein
MVFGEKTMFIQAVAQSVIARARKLRGSWPRPDRSGGKVKPGLGGLVILLIAFLLFLFLGLK